MTIVEKNDVDIAQLFTWGGKFDILGKEDEVIQSIYIRLLGDADLNRARVYALRQSADLRSKLKTTDSDERITLIFDPETLEEERLVALIVGLRIRDLSSDAQKQVKVPEPKAPKSDAPLEQMENYQKALDAYFEKRQSALREKLEHLVDKETKHIKKLPREELIKLYENSMINELCEQRVLTSFKDISAYLGTYKDSDYKERLFNSLEDFLNLPTQIKSQFISAQQSLEIGGEDLKKLQRATQ